jgi:hypothetical protein
MRRGSGQKESEVQWWLVVILRFINFVGKAFDSLGLPLCQLSEDRLLRIAKRKTRLADFDDEGFRVPFGVLVRSLQQDGAQQSLAQRMWYQTTITGALSNRLLIANELRQHPEALDRPIHRPIFIASLPRTGTTLLHRLLAQDPLARPLLAWEAFFPARRPSDLGKEPDPRIKRLKQAFDFIHLIAPRFRAMHHLDPIAPEECNALLKNAFLFFGNSSPSYRRWLLDQPAEFMEDSYRIYRRQLQLIQLNRPLEGHWVLKAPFHIYGIAPLLSLFPDSVIVMTHRDPHVSIPSLYSMSKIFGRLELEDKEQAAGLASHVLEWAGEGIRRAEAARESAGPGRVFDIQYEQLINNPLGTIQQLYSHCGYDYTDEFHAKAKVWLEKHPKDKYGKHLYSVEEGGLSRQMIDETFGWYVEKYQIASDVSLKS